MLRQEFPIAVFSCCLLLFCCSCASKYKPVAPGVIPQQNTVSMTDERYGQEVFAELANHYELSRDDAQINRVRDIVDRLAKAAHADTTPWNVYVFNDQTVQNAASTRGNFVFVWSGMLSTVQNDEELATILSHEMGHVLAGHTAEDPAEEANKMIAGVAGMAVGQVLSHSGNGLYGDLAENLIKAGIEAFLVNPVSQQREFEADQIGLFMMADAGYNPERAANFWGRVRGFSEFGNNSLSFLSTHPSSAERFNRLQKLLPQALERYQSQGKNGSSPNFPSHAKSEDWIVMEASAQVYAKPNANSSTIKVLKNRQRVQVVDKFRRNRIQWLEIAEPVQGFMTAQALSPEN